MPQILISKAWPTIGGNAVDSRVSTRQSFTARWLELEFLDMIADLKKLNKSR